MRWRIRYNVEGSGHFPLDMLRYDSSYPASESDANRAEFNSGTRTVVLERVSEDKDWAPTKGRWESFGWQVIGLPSRDRV